MERLSDGIEQIDHDSSGGVNVVGEPKVETRGTFDRKALEYRPSIAQVRKNRVESAKRVTEHLKGSRPPIRRIVVGEEKDDDTAVIEEVV